MEIFILALAFGASVAGAICGIGGGVIIKPLMDVCHIADVAQISFLSGCTVLSMSCYSVVRAVASKKSLVRFQTGTPLAIGAAIGGMLGKNLFSLIQSATVQSDRVGGYQAVCLAVLTIATLIYTLNKQRIVTLQMKNIFFCSIVGLALGVMSSFLGIGGGPINLVVLHYFFSMDTKEAAQNSLYIILISQVASLFTSIVNTSVPTFEPMWLALMVTGGILGGIVGRSMNKRLTSVMVDRLFVGLVVVIIGISVLNAWRFLRCIDLR